MEQEQLLNELIDLLAHQNGLIESLCTYSLFAIGVLGAIGVLILLYKFIRLFY